MSYRRYTDAEKAAYAAGAKKARESKPATRKAAPRKTTTTRRAAPRKTTTRRKNTYTDGALGEMLGGGIGAAIGGGPGALIGGAFGRGAHKMFKMLTGFGDYKVMENTLMTGGMSPPEIVNSSRTGGFIVRHREYIQDINATTDFTNLPFALNPGVSTTFPWLSQVAGSFEQYRLRGAVFEFKSLSSDAVLSSATSSALGAVVMATDYNVLGAPFPDKMHMENYDYSCSAKPSLSFLHPIECKRSLTPVTELYVRTSPVPEGADARLYDLGLFQIATVGMQAASGVAGELWITYECELFKPKINSDPVVADHFVFQGVVSGALPLGTLSDDARTTTSNLGGSIAQKVNPSYSFPAQMAAGSKWLVTYSIYGSAGVVIAAPGIAPTGCTIENFWNNGAVSITKVPVDGVTSATFEMSFVVTIDAYTSTLGEAYITWGAAGTLPNGSFVRDLLITQLPDNLD